MKINKLEFKNKIILFINTIIFSTITSIYVLLLNNIYLNKANMYVVNSIENKLNNNNFIPEITKIDNDIYNNIISLDKIKEQQKNELISYLKLIKEDGNVSYVEYNNLLKNLHFAIKGN